MSSSLGVRFILVLLGLNELLKVNGGQCIGLITYAFFTIGKRVNENTVNVFRTLNFYG